MNYFIIENGQQAGPFSIDQLRIRKITGETMVWHEGMAQWGKAKDVPSLATLLQLGTPPTPPPTPHYGQTSQQPPHYGYNPPQPQPQPTQPCPDNHLGLSIVATIMTFVCCFPIPIGIVALVYSLNVESKWKRGEYAKAESNAKNAKNWGIASIIAAVALFVIMLVIYALLGAACFEFLDEIYELDDYYYY